MTFHQRQGFSTSADRIELEFYTLKVVGHRGKLKYRETEEGQIRNHFYLLLLIIHRAIEASHLRFRMHHIKEPQKCSTRKISDDVIHVLLEICGIKQDLDSKIRSLNT